MTSHFFSWYVFSKVLAFCDSQRRKKNLSTWDFVKLRILHLGSNECLHPGGRTSKWHHFRQFFRQKLMIHQSKGFQWQRISDFEPTRNEALNLLYIKPHTSSCERWWFSRLQQAKGGFDMFQWVSIISSNMILQLVELEGYNHESNLN